MIKINNLYIKLLIVTFFFINLCCFFSKTALADIFFKDVPASHWASEAVYDLVKRGVTKGFPDGTFRGKKRITRYEIAVMLSKFSHSYENRDRNEKILAELKSELALIKYKRDEADSNLLFSGKLITHSRLNTESPLESREDFRLKLALRKKVPGILSEKTVHSL